MATDANRSHHSKTPTQQHTDREVSLYNWNPSEDYFKRAYANSYQKNPNPQFSNDEDCIDTFRGPGTEPMDGSSRAYHKDGTDRLPRMEEFNFKDRRKNGNLVGLVGDRGTPKPNHHQANGSNHGNCINGSQVPRERVRKGESQRKSVGYYAGYQGQKSASFFEESRGRVNRGNPFLDRKSNPGVPGGSGGGWLNDSRGSGGGHEERTVSQIKRLLRD
jgi:hypothetical protein